MTIEIVGAGTVGQAFGRALVAHGRAVRWIDRQHERVADLRRNGCHAALPTDAVEASSLYFLCVPTPTDDGRQDREPLQQALERVATLLRPELAPTVVIRSTILPGTSRTWAVPLLEKASGLACGRHFRFVCQPEFLRERHSEADAISPRINLLGEIAPGHADTLAEVLRCFDAPIVRVSAEAAELQKYVHNTLNTVKTTFFNEMRRIAEQLHLTPEVETVFAATRLSAEAVWNPLYGMRDWGPIAGACLPKDLRAFVHWQRLLEMPSPLLEGVAASNANAASAPARGAASGPSRPTNRAV